MTEGTFAVSTRLLTNVGRYLVAKKSKASQGWRAQPLKAGWFSDGKLLAISCQICNLFMCYYVYIDNCETN
ncbi:hypothetical protein OXPF_33430 [Oxobacter pfennigii]|uniref:Uncharacterized protein n=1 Tax=Oxobacter pfennigii TaxID=36849 RepID=A0A0P8W5A9_9CLOT|nr:hypothetical protein [Oxobacter pfennigii]KPU43093.1 hypothetical protein OXPF_33430 [Oxobacter pfennigii]